MSIKIPIRDRAFRHCGVSNGPTPPVCRSELIEWDFDCPNPEIYTDAEIFNAPKNNGKVAWLIEPIAGRQDAYEYLLSRKDDFREFWTSDRRLLELLPNAKFCPFGGCWISPQDRRIWPKSKGISTIASNKRGGMGYDMRHEAIARFPQIDAYGVEYTPLEHKIDALRDYRFHLVIENVRADYWFTEKLIDCFMTGTVPIYWGCPSIAKFFNPQGTIVFTELEQIDHIFPYTDSAAYRMMLPAIRDNFERAKGYCLSEDYIAWKLIIHETL